MIRLETLLCNLYADKSASVLIEWMKECEVLEPVRRTISQLNNYIRCQDHYLKNCNTPPLGHVASNFLITINSRIRQEENSSIAKDLENTLSDLAVAILEALFNDLKNPAAASMQVTAALKDTCEMFNYDYSQLLQFLKLERIMSYLRSIEHSEKAVPLAGIPYYIWKGNLLNKRSFVTMLSERKLFLRKAGLALLFDKPDKCLNLVYNPNHVNLTLQFFSNLKKQRIVTHTGCNGFYKVLEYHIPDFGKNFLRNKTAGSRLNVLKQSKAQWNENQRNIERWLQPFV